MMRFVSKVITVANEVCCCSGDLNGRSLRDSLREEDVISLRTAGDISLPRAQETVPLLHSALYPHHHTYYHPHHTAFLQPDPYREQRELFGDTYREPWTKGLITKETQQPRTIESKVSKRSTDKEPQHRRDKKSSSERRDPREDSTKRSSKSRLIHTDSHPPNTGSVGYPYGMDSRLGQSGTLPPHLLPHQLTQHPVYDNIGSANFVPYVFPASNNTGGGGGGGSNSATSTPTGSSAPFVDPSWRQTHQGMAHKNDMVNFKAYQQQQQTRHQQQQPPYHHYHPHHQPAEAVIHSPTSTDVCGAPLATVQRHNLQLRGLTSQQHCLHMQALQNNSYATGIDIATGGTSTSPDYNIRWDLHNTTAASGPSRLSAMSVESNRSDPSELRLSNLMVSGSKSAGIVCDGSCDLSRIRQPPVLPASSSASNTSTPQNSSQSMLLENMEITLPHGSVGVTPQPLLCCNNSNHNPVAATSSCCCFMTVANDPIGIPQQQLALSHLRHSRHSLHQQLPIHPNSNNISNHHDHHRHHTNNDGVIGNRTGTVVVDSHGRYHHVLLGRPHSLLPVCSTTDCHVNTQLSPVKSLADLTVANNCFSGNNANVRTVASSSSIATNQNIFMLDPVSQDRLSSLSINSTDEFKNVHEMKENNTSKFNRIQSEIASAKVKSLSSRGSISSNPFKKTSTCTPVLKHEEKTPNENIITAADDSVEVSKSVVISGKVTVLDSRCQGLGSIAKSSSASSVVSLAAVLQKTPAHIV